MTYEEMERTLIQLAELQQDNQQILRQTLGTMSKLSDLVVSFAEQQNSSLLRLEALVETFIRGSHNGGKQES